MTQGRRPEGDLPAEYVSPWHLLGRDLRAVLASLRLRLRELWRRNRQADLWRPGFWPDALAAWFWPLLLSLPLLAALLLAALLPLDLASRQAAPPASPSTPSSLPQALPPEPQEPLKPLIETEVQPQEGSKDDAAASPSPAGGAPRQEPAGREQREAPPPPPEGDPLLVALEPEGPALLLEARPLPAQGLLRLTVAPDFAQLPQDQRRQRALDWWSGARNLGYEQLELCDRPGRLLARSVLVGEGMVLFHPP